MFILWVDVTFHHCDGEQKIINILYQWTNEDWHGCHSPYHCCDGGSRK
jgi:hypothetical protein